MGLCLTKTVLCCCFCCTWEFKAERCVCGSAQHCLLHSQAEFAFKYIQIQVVFLNT